MMKIENDQDIANADALLQLVQAKEIGRSDLLRSSLASALDVTNPGWRDNPAIVARIVEVGVSAAVDGLLKKYGLVNQ